MRIFVRHETSYTYTTAPKSITQILRMTPRSHEGQHVIDWRIDCDADCSLKAGEDGFANITHALSVNGPLSELRIRVEGEVETFDTAGVVANTIERFPPMLYLRQSGLTQPDDAVRDFAHSCRRDAPLDTLHSLMASLHAHMTFDADPTHSATGAHEAFALGRGVCQDYAHILVAAARLLDIPARYVGGHFCRSDGLVNQEAGHAWAEAYIDGLGWVGFDASHGVCPGERHLRVACGLDYLDAAPVRGAHVAGEGETLTVSIAVAQTAAQTQN